MYSFSKWWVMRSASVSVIICTYVIICTQFVLHSQGKCYDWMWYDCACCAKPAGMLKFSIHPVHFFIARTSLRGQLAIFLHLQSDEKHPATVEDSSNTGILGDVYTETDAGFCQATVFYWRKKGLWSQHILSITTTAGKGDKNHINPSSCGGCGSGFMHWTRYTLVQQ